MNNQIDLLADKLDFTYKKEENPNDVRHILSVALNYWPLFLISILFCLAAAYVYIQRVPNQWNVVSKIIVDDDNNSPAKSLTHGLNSDMSSMFNVKNVADNEVKVLKSRSLMKRVISQLELNVHVYDKSGFKKAELYDDAPFKVEVLHKGDITRLGSYQVEITGDNTFSLIDPDNEVELKGTFGKPLQLRQYTIALRKANNFTPNGDYEILIRTIKQAELELANNYEVGLDDKQATIINLKLNYNDPKRGEAILSRLMQVYLQDNLANKIRITDSTMRFIDRRLVVVGAELNSAEKKLEVYKRENGISDISAQSKALIAGADTYQAKLNENEVQLAVVNDLYKYVNDARNPQVVPSSLITKDVAFGTAINAYNEMLLRKEQLGLTLVESSSVIKNLDQQIELARRALMNSLRNYRSSLQVSQGAVKKQNATIVEKISNAPVKERLYIDYQRQQNLKQELYLFLLQKREETAISQTATLSSSRILDPAESEELPFAPKKSIIYLIGLLAGFCLPATAISVKEMLNTRINSKADIENHTNVPLLGEISRNANKNKVLIYKEPRSVVSEEIRALRTSLKYVVDKSSSNVIMFTSSMSGEGKSFISLNLGNSIALTGKRVILLELDLRKPTLSQNIGISNDHGFTNYLLANDDDPIESYIRQSPDNENFYFLPSGNIPPNPAELLMDEKVKDIIADLRSKFDYVLIDTAPVGLISDAMIIEEFTDITFYVVRQNYTYKSQLGLVNDLYKTKKARDLYLIVNDIQTHKNGVTGYGHGYGKYGYGDEEEDTGLFAGLLKRLKPSN
ncbi:polysaccharide biosynthesis tyrosine autokinase [Mucilaginibacter pallidiroseus]|uniref:non-specific protein-tyrosine kinase n=1 Tax=Mucilaginibacter pallidiroseus TaxID=2599295 RepID=A0A563U0X9_9SPHI|nr:polysaccharide biosynthesis tyrosine autokinase [Mucilaginibacter pallidiroseus]TWR25213.1 polysaccharide biosynthesis tyrosine autokinase [Mucilaginibacter pallidiroseus]